MEEIKRANIPVRSDTFKKVQQLKFEFQVKHGKISWDDLILKAVKKFVEEYDRKNFK